MTALAAVIALSSTAALAQTTDAGAGQAAPVVVAPPAPEVSAPATPPAAVQPAAPEVAPAPAAPAMRTMSTPVEHGADASDASAAGAVAVPHRVAAARPAATATRTATPAPSAKSVTHVAPPPAPASSAPVAARTVEPTPAPAPIAAPPAPAPVVATSAIQTSQRTTLDDETLPIAGAVGLGLLAIGGIALAFRRKRPAEEDELMLEPPQEEVATLVQAAPLAAAPAPQAAMPAQPPAGPSTLPNGFDLSRFGRHTQAAYRGPTPDNPSYSLKHRLRRASFFDQREREAAEAGIAPAPIATPESVAARTAQTPAPAKPVPAEQDDGQLTVRLTPQRASNGFGYVFQK
jgi:hypothetical protein